VLRPDLPPQRAPEITLVASVALCHAVRRAGVDAGIKWPNDLVARGRKLGGILTEMAADPDRVQWVVLGAGLNLNSRPEEFPREIRPHATSVAAERGQPVPRALFAAAAFALLEEWLDRHAEGGFAAVRDEWRVLSETLGREVRVSADGRELTGVAEDIDGSGALLVRSGGGLVAVHAGEVEHLRPR
jgi:BirA family biotin operon repressor/biotin-[acetyl-CoA-carboxylase] ligase